MEKTFFDRFLNILLILLVIAVLGGIGYLGYKYYEKYKINNDAAEFLDNEFEKYISDRDDYDEQNAIDEIGDGDKGTRGIDADVLQYRGYRVEGKIELPTVNFRYPVLEYITDANELEVSIGIQYGVGLNKVGNTVLAGHNYRSGLFFGSNKLLNIGDPVYITDTATGQRVEYKIYQKYTTEEDDTSYFGRDTQGKREISLVTCQSNNKSRLVIWAREV